MNNQDKIKQIAQATWTAFQQWVAEITLWSFRLTLYLNVISLSGWVNREDLIPGRIIALAVIVNFVMNRLNEIAAYFKTTFAMSTPEKKWEFEKHGD